MRALPVLAFCLAFLGSVIACSSKDDTASPPSPDDTEQPPDRDANASSSSSSGGTTSSGGTGDAMPNQDAQPEASAPAVQLIGRFDTTNASAPKTAWPGARIIARFNGTGVKATLSHADGTEGGTTFMNVVVDGAVKTPIEVTTASQMFTLASGLALGDHTIELQKRTEPSHGTLTFGGFTYEGGTGLLPPPPLPTRRIEFLSDSTIDGYGVDGDVATTCTMGNEPKFDDPRKSIAFLTAEAVSAEMHLIAYSGKGVARNEDGSTTELFENVYAKTLPEAATSPWAFNGWVPDVVVVAVGGSDFATDLTPAGFDAAYAALIAGIRTKYGAGPRIVMLVWSQLKEYNGVRQAVIAAMDASIGTDPKISRFTLPEAVYPGDETACEEHANAAHHQAMSTLLVAELKSKLGW